MNLPLISTKFTVPRCRTEWIARPRLILRLNQAVASQHRLILVAAPAGSGKTTLMCQWAAQLEASGRAVAWLSLDDHDNDPRRCLNYLTAALQKTQPQLGEELRHRLHAAEAPTFNVGLAVLLHEINQLSVPIVFVVDNYHVIQQEEIQAGLSYLLDYLPANLSLVINTRQLPPFPLSRFRLRQQMAMIDARHLNFTASEVKQFFARARTFTLSAAQLDKLAQQTEGWAAGLQFAALAMQNVDDLDEFVDQFGGSHQLVASYLAAEVLSQQPEAVQKFLLETSILNQLNPELCNRVTQRNHGYQMFERLVANNMFIIPLDHKQEWYRYHHLFGQSLHYKLKTITPDLVPWEFSAIEALHHRAAAWYQEHHLVDEALYHFLSAKEFDNARKLLEAQIPPVLLRGDVRTIRRWLNAAPKRVIDSSPRLLLYSIWVYSLFDQYQEMATAVERAQTHLASVEAVSAIDWQTELKVQKVWVLYGRGDIETAIALCRDALTHIPAGNHILQGATYVFLCRFANDTGNLNEAHQYARLAMKHMRQSGFVVGLITAAVQQARVHMLRGEQREALAIFEQTLTWVKENDWQGAPLVGTLYTGYSLLLYVLNRVTEAEQYLKQSIVINQSLEALPQEFEARLTLRRCQWAMGQAFTPLTTEPALESLWLKISRADYPPLDICRLGLNRVEQWLREGQLVPARQWLRQPDWSLAAQPGYYREQTQIARARLSILSGDNLPAIANHLEQLQQAASEDGRVVRTMEIMILQAMVRAKLNQPGSARETLQKALILAEWTGFIRLIMDEGQHLTPLLAQTNHSLARELLQQMGHAPPDLIDPLSERELEVLRLYAAGFNRTEIARQLVISNNAVKWHLKNIYSKLNVHRRAEAVARAEALNMLS